MAQPESTDESGPPEPFEVTGGYERFRRAWIHVTGAAALVGKCLEIREADGPLPGERLLGQTRLRGDSGRSTARLELPMPPPGHPYGTLALWLDGRPVSQVKLPDADEERLRAFRAVELHFAPYVFAGRTFPSCDFEQPSLVEDLIGRYAIRTTFYDGDYQPVTSAERAGRYGAVVEIEAADGRIFKRFRTLFRQPDPADGRICKPGDGRLPVPPLLRMSQPEPVWYGRKGPFPVELPPELGIDPAVVHEQGTTLYEFFRGRWKEGYWDDPWTPILLAGLYETSPGSGPSCFAALRRNNAWEQDRRWWSGLKQRTGEAPMPHLLYLPREYDQVREKRWPLLLYLHGSGELGDDLDRVRRSGLAKLAEEGQPFPFILVAPQCPEDEWFWLPAALNALLDDVSARYRVDPDRVYATGLSMGGRGTWVLAIEYPDRFAAIAPICGSIPDLEEASRIRHLPVWAFLGAKDHDQSIRKMVEALQAVGGNVRLTVYPDVGHNAWTPTYANPAFYEWLLSHRRTPRPD